jgi:predicted ATPase
MAGDERGRVTRRYVLTGAPGSGRTSLLHALARRGWPVVPEAATDVIAREQAAGRDEPWLSPGFATGIVGLQRERQSRPAAAGVQFFDRSPLCTLALARFLGHPVAPELEREVDRVIREGVYQADVFLVRPLGFVEATAARRITREDAVAFEAVHEAVYRDHGYALIDLTPASVSARADAVEAHLRRCGAIGS